MNHHLSIALAHTEIERRVADAATRGTARLARPRGRHPRHLPFSDNRPA